MSQREGRDDFLPASSPSSATASTEQSFAHKMEELTKPANLDNNVGGSTILITGGASGLGEVMFLKFAQHGFVLPIFSRFVAKS